jgi:hypothetical protein
VSKNAWDGKNPRDISQEAASRDKGAMKLKENNIDREWFLRYVLGELSQDETRIADERFFSDDFFAMAVEETYRDLLDDYATGAITARERDRVQHAFFSGPYQGRQLKVLQAMQSLLRKTPVVPETASARLRPPLLSFWPLAVSACVLSLAVALIVFVHTQESRRASVRNAPSETASVKSPEPQAPASPSAGPVATAPRAPESAFTILLLPHVTRGSQSAETFSIPPSADKVNFQVVVPGRNPSSATFDVRLSDANGHELRFLRSLSVRKLGAQAYVQFAVASGELPAGEYIVDVFASSAAKDQVAHFSLHVARDAAHLRP